MKNTIQINYWTLGGFEGKKPIAQALREAKEMGYDGVELTFGAGVFNVGITRQECTAIRKETKVLGLRLASLASGNLWGCLLSSPDKQEREKAIAFTKDYLQVANWLGVKVVLVIPGAVDVAWDPSKPVVPYQQVWENSTASLRRLLPVARKLGVCMALENVWNKFLLGPVEMKTFLDQFKSPFVKCYFDVANCVINGYPEHWIEILGNRIGAVHFKNFSRSNCAGTLHGFGDDLLQGDVNWEGVVKALKNIRYRGPITAEMLPFSRLPNMVLPDLELARDTAVKMRRILA